MWIDSGLLITRILLSRGSDDWQSRALDIDETGALRWPVQVAPGLSARRPRSGPRRRKGSRLVCPGFLESTEHPSGVVRRSPASRWEEEEDASIRPSGCRDCVPCRRAVA